MVWRDAEPIDLNTEMGDRAWHLSKAQGITVSGQIIGESELGGEPHLFVLTPTQPWRCAGRSPSSACGNTLNHKATQNHQEASRPGIVGDPTTPVRNSEGTGGRHR